MMRFTVDIRMRPIRIAFFVAPNDANAVARAISINSFLWGGHLNPIIPQFKRTPREWQNEILPTPRIGEVLNGYLEAFDPDFVTHLDCDPQKFVGDDSRQTVEVDKLLSNLGSTGSPTYGVGYFELARHVGYEEMRFERRKPLHFVAPPIAGDYAAFLASVIGSLPVEIAEDTRQQLRDAYEAPEISASMDAFGDCLDRTYLTPLRLIRHRLKPDQFAPAWQRNYVFYLDASSLLDVIDFWNLRALGFNVLPVPKQAATQPKVLDAIKRFVKENHSVSRHDPAIAFNIRILQARSISKGEFEEFVSSSPAVRDFQESPARPTIQAFFPHFWDRWHREHNQCDCIRFFGDSSESEVTPDDNWIRFRPLIPEFADRNAGGLSVANEVSFRTYADGEPMAQVFPQANEKLGAPFGTRFHGDWRFSSAGPVHFPRFRSSALFGIPKSQTVVEQWFACNGWKVSISQAGLATRELLKHLGGAYMTSQIADEDTVSLLGELSKGKAMTNKQLRSKAWRIAKKRDIESPDGIISTLMTSRLVALGVQIKCTTCGRHPWYELSGIRPVVECTECLRDLELPLHTPDDIEWAYRGTGPLVALSTSTGAFPVLLTLRFISFLMHVQTTPAFGVEVSRDGQVHEMDLGGFALESQFRRSRTRMFFAECKGYNRFEPDDVKRIGSLGLAYPGSILVFATLRRELDEKEIKSLSTLARNGRRRVGAEEPVNPVMILTGTELFAPYGITSHWEELGDRYASLAGQLRHESDLLGLCSITQQLYLAMNAMSLPV